MPDRSLERPEPASLLDVDLGPRDRSPSRARVGRTHPHPLLEGRDRLVGQFLLGRHAQAVISVVQRLDQEALVRLARHDCRPRIAAGAEAFTGVE